MARRLMGGNVVNGYTIVRFLSSGAMATSYEAMAKDGRRVFFKQYKSPSPTVPWYGAFKRQQGELKKRVTTSPVKGFCYDLVDFFEAEAGGRCYFQVFEFVDRSDGGDLGDLIKKVREHSGEVTWEQRLVLTRKLVAGIRSLHAAKIVHCDLKPGNVLLIRDESIAAKYNLKLIDMDFSILADKRAAWDGTDTGYVGSPNYFSPEHLRGKPPTPASDVFTLALILYELLAEGHPYASEEPEEYARAVTSHRAKPARLGGSLPPPLSNEKLTATLFACLDPDAARRPSADDLLATLNPTHVPSGLGKAGSPPPLPAPRPPAPASPSPTTPSPSPTPAASPDCLLRLVGPDGREVRIAVSTKIGKRLLQAVGNDAKFFDEEQFSLERIAGDSWVIVARAGTTNQTLLNGTAVAGKARLRDGDVLSVGNEVRRISVLPLTVRIGPGESSR